MKDSIKDCGVVAAWKGKYGFIRPDGGGHSNDIFFHQSHIAPGSQQFVRPGMKVAYHLAPDTRHADRLRAVDVTVLSANAAFRS